MSDIGAVSYENVIAVTNRALCARPFKEQVARVCALHPRGLILREKDLSPREYERLAAEINEICISLRVPLILHTHADASLKLDINRIHLTTEALKNLADRSRFTEIGASVHSAEEAVAAQRAGATYITAGHIYRTDCKPGLEPRGTEFLRRVCESVDIPVFAIGGIKPTRGQMEEIMSCGAAGACVMSAAMSV